MEKLEKDVQVTYKKESMRHWKGKILRQVDENPQRKVWMVEWEIDGVGRLEKPELEQNLMLAGKILE